MNNKNLFLNSGQLAALALIAFLCCGSQNSFAAVPGCDKAVYDVIRNQAEAKVAYEVAVAEQNLKTPPSTLEMTCFGTGASSANEKASKILTGNFLENTKNKIKDTFENALKGHIKKNFPRTGGADNGIGLNGNPKAKLGTTTPYECDGMQKTEEKMDEPLVDIPDFESLSGGNAEALKSLDKDKAADFLKSWEASSDQNIIKDAQESKEVLSQNDSPISLLLDETPCQVLLKTGINISCNTDGSAKDSSANTTSGPGGSGTASQGSNKSDSSSGSSANR